MYSSVPHQWLANRASSSRSEPRPKAATASAVVSRRRCPESSYAKRSSPVIERLNSSDHFRHTPLERALVRARGDRAHPSAPLHEPRQVRDERVEVEHVLHDVVAEDEIEGFVGPGSAAAVGNDECDVPKRRLRTRDRSLRDVGAGDTCPRKDLAEDGDPDAATAPIVENRADRLRRN